MNKKHLFGILMVIMTILLLLNLLSYHHLLPGTTTVRAEEPFHRVTEDNPQSLGFRGNGVGITCSSDGKFVYAAGNGTIFRSEDYGKKGTWKIVLAN